MDVYAIREAMLKKNRRLSDISLRVVYYARVSTEKDAQLHSLSAQKNYFENKIAQNPNWTLIRGYVDEGTSATTVKNRDNFLQMIMDAKMDKFDLILTKEITRFARNTLDSLSYTQELLRHGVGVCFENDNLNTLDPDSELRLTIMSGIAQDESRRISERVSFGFKRSIESGTVLGNNSIWGYRKENGRLVIVPEEAEMVRIIFDLCANKDMGTRKIASTISGMGYLNSNNNPFSASSIKGILVNPKYKGFYCGNKTHKIDFRHEAIKHLSPDEWIMYEDKENVPAIVSVELWDRANKKLLARSRKTGGKNKTSYQNRYLYSGKIFCGEHNTCYHHAVYKYKSGNKELWACKEYASGNKCRSPIVYTAEIDSVMREVYSRIFCENTKIINDLITIYTKNDCAKAITKSKHKIQSDINSLFSKKDKLLDLVTDNRISNSEFEERNNALNREIKILQARLSNLSEEEKKSVESAESIENLRQSIENELDFTNELGKNVVDSLIEKIVVYKSDTKNQIDLKIFLKVLPSALQKSPESSTAPNLGSGQIIVTRGGNSKALKPYDLAFNYQLVYKHLGL